mgnify:CR=1 FL=1
MYSAEWALVCYVNIVYIFSFAIFLTYNAEQDLQVVVVKQRRWKNKTV